MKILYIKLYCIVTNKKNMYVTQCCTRLLQQQIKLNSVTNMMQCAVSVTIRLAVLRVMQLPLNLPRGICNF